MIKALIFDFDGMILETETPIYNSWNELYQSFGCKIPLASWVTLIGGKSSFDPFAELERQVGSSLDRSALEPQRQKREMELIVSQKILPGVTEYLDDAKKSGMKIGVASSSPDWWVTGHLTRLGIKHYFDCICSRDNVERVKPAPDLYLKALKKLNLQPNEAVVLEDSPNGIKAAKTASLFCVAVPNDMTRDLCLDQADLKLYSLLDMPLKEVISLAENNHR